MKPTRLTANLVLLLGAFSLSNPLRAQEQLDASDGVGVDVIDGVNSTSVDEFGNLILTMESGETVTVLSGEYFIYDGSYYLTSDALANLGLSIEDAAAVVVAAAGGGGGGSTLLLVGGGVLLLAAAAGGGGGGSSAPAPAPAPPVNNAPSFTSANSSNAAENTTTAYDANATDPDGNSITYGLTGTDASLFTINSSTGVVSFINPPDFENPGDSDGDNVYDVNVTASDGSLSVSQGVSITVTDQNDAPVVSAAIEDETSENAGLSVDLLQNASDQDGDTLSIANVVETSGNDASGVSISGSTLTVDMTTYDYLAEGETVVLVYTYDVEDGNGGTVSTSATITITGQNDAPILAVVDIAATEDGAPVDGASTASDVDISDTHVFTTTQPTEGSVSIDAATGVYTFDPGEDFQYLADGETTTVSFDVTVTDNNGLSDTQTVTVTVTGTNDVPVIVEAESDLSGDVTQVPLADAASSSAFTAVGEVIGVNELNGILPTEGSSMALLNAQGATDAEIEAELGLAPGTLDVHAGQDVVDGSGITTAVTLTAGQVVTFDWNFQDAEGDVPVTTDINDFAFVSVNGDVSYLERSSDVDTNEWTTYSFTAPADGTYVFGIGVVNEGDDAVDSQLLVDNFSVDGVLVDGAEGLDSLTTSGTITFTDLDFTDTHGTEVEPDAGNTLGGIMVLTGVSEDPTTEPGTFDWTYVVDNEATAYLAEGETTTESFTVFVGDDFSDIDVPGTFDSQVITITITGTNDAPVISVVDLAATEDGATVDGTATFTDVDLIDTHEFTTTQPLEGSVTIDAATGVYTFDPGADFQYLADAETATVTFDVTVTDNNGLSDTQTVSVTVTGTNDTPIIEVVDVEGAVIEDATTPNLTDAGSVTFTEIDDTDVITSSVALTAEATDSAEPIPADLSAALASAVTITQTGTNDGDIAWDFSLDNALTQYIADGETVTATYTITVMDDSGTANDTATQDVTVVITGTNDQPTLTILDTDGAMDEGDDNAVLSDSGALSFDDIDATDIVTVSQTYNDDIAYSGALDPADPIDPVNLALEADLIAGFSVDQDSWDYTSSEDLDFLGLGETITLSFDVVATDDSGTANNTSDPVTVTITFTGTNDAAVVTGVVEGEVGEGDLVDTVFGDLNHTDVDNTDPDGLFQADSGATTYGTYTVDADGNWSFTLDNANPATEALTAGEVVTDSFSAFADDGTEQVITVTINGSNDGAILSADVENLVETDLAADISTSGALTISDVDAGEAVFVAQAGSVGDYGTFTIDATGAWTYTASSAHDEFVDGVTYTDTFSVQSADGTTTSVTINILGTDDAAILSADVVALTETDSALDISTTGTLTISDSDSPEEFVVQTGTLGDYGTFTIDADGSWTYAASTAHNEFEDGVVYTDTFSVESADGTTTSVTINITGTNDAAVVSSDSVDLIETDAALTADGVLTSSDVDNTDNAFTASTTTGTLGEFDIDALGAWTFTANSAFDELNDGDVISETFDVASADGTPSTVTITITGSNDSASIVASLMEDTATTEAGIDAVGAPVAGDTDAGGTLIITDADDGEAVFQAPASLAGTYGDFTFDAATGVWAYTLNNADPDTQALAAGDPATDTLTVTSQDGTASYDIVVNITGTNDAAEITGTSSGLVLEDFAINVVSGDLQNTDIDGTDQVFQAGAGAGDNAYGTYTVDAEGTWTYSLSNANADVNALNVGDTLIDSFTVLSEDGTEQDVTITIYGSNDGPVAVADMVTTNEDTLVNIDVLDNDTDVDNLPADLSVTSVSASNGTVTINPDNTLDYTPDADYNGSDVIFYTISDGNGGVDTGTVAVTVTPVNDAPVFATDAVAASTAEDQVLTGTVNATDVDADVLTYTIEIGDGAANGTAAVDASGNYTYTPNDDFNGTDSFVITVTDNGTGALTDTITVNVTINPINDAPVASVTAAAALTEGVDASGTAVATVSQTDPDAGDTHSYAIIGGNEAGLFTIDAGTGEITTTRDLDDAEVGSYQLTLLVEDAAGAQDAIILDVTVTNVNDAPIVAVDSATTAEDTAVTISAALLLANDTDADGDALSINAPLVTTTWDDDGNAATAEVPAGTVALVDGNLVFTPDTNFVGDVIITYNVNDGTVDVPSSVVVTVGGTNDAPVATVTPTNTSLTENDALDDTGTEVATLSHTDADVGDTHSYAIIAGNEAGLFAIDAGTGVITTTRDLDDAEVGSYQLTLLVEDGAGAQDAVTLDVTVENVNDAPVVTVDAASTAEDTPVTISGALLVSNDTDADGDTLSIDTDITVAPTASSGTVALVDGDLVFTPAENFVGNVTITYNVTDGNGASVASSVVVSVSPVNDAPVTDDAETLTVDEDTAGMVSPLTGDTDVDGDTLTITGAVASNGTVTESGGVLTYTPDADFNGSDEIVYTISDGNGGVDTGTIAVTVNPVNDAPVIAGEDTGTVTEDVDVTAGTPDTIETSGNLTVTDVDAGEAAFSTTVVTQGVLGELTIDALGNWTYVADNTQAAIQSLGEGESTTDTITVESADGTDHDIVITIIGTNDGPVAANLENTDLQSEDEAAYTVDLNVANILGITLADLGTDVDNTLTSESFSLNGVTIAGTLYSAADAGIGYNPTTGEITINTGTDAYQYLAENETAEVVVSYTVTDGLASDTGTVTFTVTGVNDAAIITGNDAGDVAEDALVDSATGDLNNTDVDGADNVFQAAGPTATTLGTYEVDADGTWTYTLDNGNTTVDALAEGETTTDSFSVLSEDGTSQLVTVTITGANDAPVAVDVDLTAAPQFEDEAVVTIDLATGLDNYGNDLGLTIAAVATDVDSTLTIASFSLNDVTIDGTLYSAADAGISYDPGTGLITVDTSVDAYQGLSATDVASVVASFTVTDDFGATDTATVTFAVNGVN
ncbi:MAG: tandem-95 repeat protein, partial [Gammaproteobacteria bacterium]|nr:tandem-95 repeat protein [Gammaproteobacteria bacterium]